MTCGIYAILNNNNGHIYIGQSVNIENRFRGHQSDLSRNIHHNSHLQNSWNYYGGDNFSFLILERCDRQYLDMSEIFWIEYTNSTNRKYGYNTEPGGRCGNLNRQGPNNPNFGKHWSKEWKHKQSLRRKEYYKKNPEAYKRIVKQNQDYWNNKQHREEQHQRMLGKHDGEKHPQALYCNLWDINICEYDSRVLKQCQNLCKCFRLKFNKYRPPIGSFLEWESIYIIDKLIKEFL